MERGGVWEGEKEGADGYYSAMVEEGWEWDGMGSGGACLDEKRRFFLRTEMHNSWKLILGIEDFILSSLLRHSHSREHSEGLTFFFFFKSYDI